MSSSDWQGKSDGGNDEFKDGAMYWTGTMSAVLSVPKDPAVLTIQAKGEPADGIYPYMIVELDGKQTLMIKLQESRTLAPAPTEKEKP